MTEVNLVVARYKAGQMVKGTTQDFNPNRDVFHVLPIDGGPAVRIAMRDLKAIFFVKTLGGDSRHIKSRAFPEKDQGPHQGKRIAVLFHDGELLVGHSLVFSKDRPGFFLFPADPAGNNQRIYVITAAAKEVKVGPAADELVRAAPERKPPPAKGGAAPPAAGSSPR